MATGRITWSTGEAGGSRPFLASIKWRQGVSYTGWLDQHDLSPAEFYDDQVHIDHWIALPPESEVGK